MNINVLLILLAALGIWRAWCGFRKGMVEELNQMISLLAAAFVLLLGYVAFASFRSHDNKNGVIAAIVLVMIGLALHILGVLLKAIKAIAALPLINIANAVLGIAVGVAEAIVGAWILYCIIQYFPTGDFGKQIMEWTNENEWLVKLYQSNYLMKLPVEFDALMEVGKGKIFPWDDLQSMIF